MVASENTLLLAGMIRVIVLFHVETHDGRATRARKRYGVVLNARWADLFGGLEKRDPRPTANASSATEPTSPLPTARERQIMQVWRNRSRARCNYTVTTLQRELAHDVL